MRAKASSRLETGVKSKELTIKIGEVFECGPYENASVFREFRCAFSPLAALFENSYGAISGGGIEPIDHDIPRRSSTFGIDAVIDILILDVYFRPHQFGEALSRTQRHRSAIAWSS
jgi:hypothetical protein